jgi:hypothetical protein
MAEAKPEEGPVEHLAVTGRPQDDPLPNTTFAERAKANAKAARNAKPDVEVEHAPASAPRKAAKK